MARKTGPRKISFLPNVTYFKPAGIKMSVLEEVELGHDEVEAIRLKHLAKLDQETAAHCMGVSQPTFHRLLSSAHEKLAEAVIEGKALRIEGGNVTVQEGFQAASCDRPRDCGRHVKRQGAKHSKGTVSTKGPEIVVVASVDGTLEGAVDERFGRCRKLVVCNLQNQTIEVMDNHANMGVAQGAGIQTAQHVVDIGAKTVIGGHFGPKAFQLLDVAGLDIFTAATMSVGEALQRFQRGQLSRLAGPDVDSHW